MNATEPATTDNCPRCGSARLLTTHTRRPATGLLVRYKRCRVVGCGGRLVFHYQVAERLVKVTSPTGDAILATNSPQSEPAAHFSDAARENAE